MITGTCHAPCSTIPSPPSLFWKINLQKRSNRGSLCVCFWNNSACIKVIYSVFLSHFLSLCYWDYAENLPRLHMWCWLVSRKVQNSWGVWLSVEHSPNKLLMLNSQCSKMIFLNQLLPTKRTLLGEGENQVGSYCLIIIWLFSLCHRTLFKSVHIFFREWLNVKGGEVLGKTMCKHGDCYDVGTSVWDRDNMLKSVCVLLARPEVPFNW